MIKKNVKVGKVKGITQLKFGTGEIELATGFKEDIGVLAFRSCKKQRIGVPVRLPKTQDTVEKYKPEVIMAFNSQESLDAVIEGLIFIKSKMRNKKYKKC